MILYSEVYYCENNEDIIYDLLFIIYDLLFIIYYLLFIIYYLWFIIYYLLFIIYDLWFALKEVKSDLFLERKWESAKKLLKFYDWFYELILK
jgi:hypothetical protein